MEKRWTIQKPLFPASAGVILTEEEGIIGLGIPRMRGGDPDYEDIVDFMQEYSPHTRG